jgi:mono/diheme cytochrome c family protein
MQLWAFQTGAGMNAPASVFAHGGKQYVVAYSAGNLLVGAPRGDSVWLFALDGTLPQAQERDTENLTTAVAPSAAAVAVAGSGAGAQLFQQACVPCHGADGKGGHGGGAPLDTSTDLAAVIRTVTDGRNNMPPFGAALTVEQIRAVSTYVVEELFEQPRK